MTCASAHPDAGRRPAGPPHVLAHGQPPQPEPGQPQADALPITLEDLDMARACVDDALTGVSGRDLDRAAAILARLVDQYVAPRLAARRRRLAACRAGNYRRHADALPRDILRASALIASRRWDDLCGFTQAVVRARAEGLTWTQIAARLETSRDVAYGVWRRLPRPGYPDIGSLIPAGRHGGQAGYVVGSCRHPVARSDWDAGVGNCEQCRS